MSGVDARRIALLSTSDTDLLSARASGSYYLYANPAKTRIDSLADQLARCDLIILRVLGSPQMYAEEVATLRGLAKPLVVVGGEQVPDAALMELSKRADRRCRRCARLPGSGWAHKTWRELAGFLSDTVLLTGVGFDQPIQQASWGELPRSVRAGSGMRHGVGILSTGLSTPRVIRPISRPSPMPWTGRRNRRPDIRDLVAGSAGGSGWPFSAPSTR